MNINQEKRISSSQDEALYKVATRRYVFWTGILLGVGIAGFLDETLLHQLLHWHLVNELVCSSPASRNDTILGICRNDVPYEVIFDLIALIVLSTGILWWRRVSHALPTSDSKMM